MGVPDIELSLMKCKLFLLEKLLHCVPFSPILWALLSIINVDKFHQLNNYFASKLANQKAYNL
jgi:hypothetical protein